MHNAKSWNDSPFNSNRATPECECDAASRHGSGGREQLRLLPAVILVLLPKCPLCLAAWFGIFGSVSASAWLRAVWGIPLAVTLLGIAVLSLVLAARERRDWRALLVGTLGAAALLAGKYEMDQPILVCVGLALFIVASLWTGWRSTTRSTRSLHASSRSQDWIAGAPRALLSETQIGVGK